MHISEKMKLLLLSSIVLLFASCTAEEELKENRGILFSIQHVLIILQPSTRTYSLESR